MGRKIRSERRGRGYAIRWNRDEGNRGRTVSRLVGTVGSRPTGLIMFDIAKLQAPSLSPPRLIFADRIPPRSSAVPTLLATMEKPRRRQTESFPVRKRKRSRYLDVFKKATRRYQFLIRANVYRYTVGQRIPNCGKKKNLNCAIEDATRRRSSGGRRFGKTIG